MISDTEQPHQILNESYFHRQWGDELLGHWRLLFVEGPGHRQIKWLFTLDRSAAAPPRGYVDSVRQRFESGRKLPSSGTLLTSMHLDEDGIELLVEQVEGEPLPVYLNRAKPAFRVSLGLLTELVLRLRELSPFPRLLSNVQANDFLVTSRHGASVEAVMHPVFPIIREETARSDFEIACFWGEYVARLVAAARDEWKKEVADYDPASHRAFRKLLKTLHAGREMSTAEALEELERCLRRELDSLRPTADALREFPAPPLGPLRRFLLEELALEYPEKLPDGMETDGNLLGSPYVLALRQETDSPLRQGVLLPPERWFRNSLIQGVNRKMATPFLTGHPNTARVRSLFCEENFSLIITDHRPGIPLPTLLQVKGGVETADALRLAGKIRRALDQFDSAEFDFDFESPWQVEVYLLREGDTSYPGALLSSPCTEWPVWDIRLRVEVPTEAVLESEDRSAWSFLLQKLGGKAFPALVAWMLEWRRLEWAARQGTLEREPISWDRRFDSLFSAAADYFEPGNPSHRERLLRLIEEGYGPVDTP